MRNIEIFPPVLVHHKSTCDWTPVSEVTLSQHNSGCAPGPLRKQCLGLPRHMQGGGVLGEFRGIRFSSGSLSVVAKRRKQRRLCIVCDAF